MFLFTFIKEHNLEHKTILLGPRLYSIVQMCQQIVESSLCLIQLQISTLTSHIPIWMRMRLKQQYRIWMLKTSYPYHRAPYQVNRVFHILLANSILK